jgi:hypothetical protein
MKSLTLGHVDRIPKKLEGLPFHEAERQLTQLDSYDRAIAIVLVLLRAPTATDRLKTLLECWNMCDAPWSVRTPLADIPKKACAEVRMAELLPPIARSFCDELPVLVPVWRGCERGRERGMSGRLNAFQKLCNILRVAPPHDGYPRETAGPISAEGHK